LLAGVRIADEKIITGRGRTGLSELLQGCLWSAWEQVPVHKQRVAAAYWCFR
jgi:hypothetical protein